MRAHVLPILCSGSVFLALAAPAMAQDVTVYGGVHSAYAFPDVGQTFSDYPVFQGGVTVSNDDCSLDLWNSSELRGGRYGHRGYGDEFDATATCGRDLGPVHVEVSAAYWAVGDLDTSRDDYIAYYAEASHTFAAGEAEITPYVRAIGWDGFNDPDAVIMRPGVRVATPLSDRWSANGEIAYAYDVETKDAVPWAKAGLDYELRDGVSISFSVQAAAGMRTVFGLGASTSF